MARILIRIGRVLLKNTTTNKERNEFGSLEQCGLCKGVLSPVVRFFISLNAANVLGRGKNSFYSSFVVVSLAGNFYAEFSIGGNVFATLEKTRFYRKDAKDAVVQKR